MTDQELSELTRRYVYEKDDAVAEQLKEQIQAEYARRGVAIYKPEHME